MKTYIVDASFVLTGLAGSSPLVAERWEALLEAAVRKEVQLLTTHYFSVEVANGLRYTYSAELVSESLRVIAALPISAFTLSFQQFSEVSRIAAEYKTTVYDCGCHYLALIHKGVFITCDKKYFDKAKDLGSIELL